MAGIGTTLTREARIGDIAMSGRRLISKAMWPVLILLAVELGVLVFSADPGTQSFVLICLGTVLVLGVWSKMGSGLPILPLLAVQNLVAFGLPIAAHNENVVHYTTQQLTDAGWEVFAFSAALIGSWRAGMQIFHTGSPLCYALIGFNENSPKLARVGMNMVIGSSIYEFLNATNLLSTVLHLLPAGSESIVHVLISAVSACGFFLGAMMIGKGKITGLQRSLFWLLLTMQCYIAASAFLLSSTITVVFSVAIGYFWGSGRLPTRFIIVVLVVLSYLNLGKFIMRERYWLKGEGNPTPQFTLGEMPRYYSEWVNVSWQVLTNAEVEGDTHEAFSQMLASGKQTQTGQTLLDRINNLQNLLYVIDVMQTNHVKPVGGATYTLIPPLLVPRIIWPNKPRTHEGQVLLNVHFGRQDLHSTLQTYIAWGLLAEAYGNFGPIAGSIILGLFLGGLLSWIEQYTARKLLLSVEGFLSFTLFLGMANSFEMVASVLVTSLFQACVPIVLASIPFVHRTAGRTAQPAAAARAE